MRKNQAKPSKAMKVQQSAKNSIAATPPGKNKDARKPAGPTAAQRIAALIKELDSLLGSKLPVTRPIHNIIANGLAELNNKIASILAESARRDEDKEEGA